jgi:hypothetical protein
MTTWRSPISLLKKQADQIAKLLKKIERGEVTGGKIDAARTKPCLKYGVAMDDKFISIDMPWAMIRESSEPALAEFVLKQMMEAREQ